MGRKYKRKSNGQFAGGGGGGGTSKRSSRQARKVARLKTKAIAKTNQFRDAQADAKKHTFATADGGAIVRKRKIRKLVKTYQAAGKAQNKYHAADVKFKKARR